MSNSLCKPSDKLNDLILSRTKTATEVLIFEENNFLIPLHLWPRVFKLLIANSGKQLPKQLTLPNKWHFSNSKFGNVLDGPILSASLRALTQEWNRKLSYLHSFKVVYTVLDPSDKTVE